MKFAFLSESFIGKVGLLQETEKKADRPYIVLLAQIDDLCFAIPLRSQISHTYAFITDEASGCGADYTKAIIITNQEDDLDNERMPHIRPNEFSALRGKEYEIERGMKRYILMYKKAVKAPTVPRNANLIKYSTLQNYYKELKL